MQFAKKFPILDVQLHHTHDQLIRRYMFSTIDWCVIMLAMIM